MKDLQVLWPKFNEAVADAEARGASTSTRSRVRVSI